MKNLLLIVLAGLLLAGCAKVTWYKPGATQADYSRDDAICQREAQADADARKPPPSYSTVCNGSVDDNRYGNNLSASCTTYQNNGGPANATQAIISGLTTGINYGSAWRNCMVIRGWTAQNSTTQATNDAGSPPVSYAAQPEAARLTKEVEAKKPLNFFPDQTNYLWAECRKTQSYDQCAIKYPNGALSANKESQEKLLALASKPDLGRSPDDENKIGDQAFGKKDYPNALEHYRVAAEQGYSKAQLNLGVMYENGFGVQLSYADAMKWFKKAADQGLANAETRIGQMYQKALGVPQDYVVAMKWYKLAAEKGDATAQNNLGVMYADGLGVAKDPTQARSWYQKAIDQGLPKASENMSKLDSAAVTKEALSSCRELYSDKSLEPIRSSIQLDGTPTLAQLSDPSFIDDLQRPALEAYKVARATCLSNIARANSTIWKILAAQQPKWNDSITKLYQRDITIGQFNKLKQEIQDETTKELAKLAK